MLIEVTFLMVILMLPLFYLVGTVGRLQAGAYAASGAAREAGRAYVTADEAEMGPGRSVAAADLVFGAHGFDSGEGSVAVSCGSSVCSAPGGSIVVTSTVNVTLPLIPTFLSGVIPNSVTLTSSHTEPIDEFKEG